MPEAIAKAFLRGQPALFRLDDSEVAGLRLLRQAGADGLSFLVFGQTLNDIDVFQGLVRVVVDRDGRVVEAGASAVVPGVRVSTVPGLNPEEAVRAAYGLLELPQPDELRRLERTRGRRAVFRHPAGDHFTPITAELAIFPMDGRSALLAWRILLEVDSHNWFELLLDANSGRLLFLHNLYRSAAGRVFRESPARGPSELVDFPGEWLPPGATVTTGNNVDAYLDTNGDNKPDTTSAAGLSDGRASSDGQQFDFPAGDRTTCQNPRNFKPAAVTSAFYFVNLAHDYFYRLGFDEAAGNFQADNFDRGGSGNDAVRVEAQDGAVTENANFAATPDGTPPRMQLGLFTYKLTDTNSHNDAAYDGPTIFHEYTHGVTNRIIGAGRETSCLRGVQSGAMGEGWSDYFAASCFNNPVIGEYLANNEYYGFRRNSYDRYPYTYEDLGNHGFEVHNDGEIWAAVLWQIRQALGAEVADKLIFAALRLTPCGPTMTAGRDAIVLADEQLNAGSNRAALWQVFARFGLGASASGIDGSWRASTVFTAGYDLPADLQTGNRPPAVRSAALDTLAFGGDFVYRIATEDPDGGTLSYQLVKGPPGMSVDAASGEVRWHAGFPGSDARIAVSDGQGGRVLHGFSVQVETPVQAGSPLVISGREGSAGLATIEVPDGAAVLQVTLRGTAGDPDMVLINPNGVLSGVSGRTGSMETISVPQPVSGKWIIEVAGFRNYWDTSLAAGFPEPIPLTIPATLSDLSGEYTSETFYKVTLPAGEPSLNVQTSGGAGDVDLYLRRGAVAACTGVTGCRYDLRSTGNGTGEELTLTDPPAADYYISLLAFKAYSGVTLRLPTPPVLQVASELEFTAVVNGPAPPSQRIQIVAEHGEPISWTATVTGPWLSMTPLSGTQADIPAVIADPRGLAAGTYEGTIKITAAGALGSPATIKVKLEVKAS